MFLVKNFFKKHRVAVKSNKNKQKLNNTYNKPLIKCSNAKKKRFSYIYEQPPVFYITIYVGTVASRENVIFVKFRNQMQYKQKSVKTTRDHVVFNVDKRYLKIALKHNIVIKFQFLQ